MLYTTLFIESFILNWHLCFRQRQMVYIMWVQFQFFGHIQLCSMIRLSLGMYLLRNIGAYAGGHYKHVFYTLYKGIHVITVNPTNNGATTWTIYHFSSNKNLWWSQEFIHSFAMSDVRIKQACDTLHVDLFNSISQKSNNEIMRSPIFENIQLP